jgi:hypothetical protein
MPSHGSYQSFSLNANRVERGSAISIPNASWYS